MKQTKTPGTLGKSGGKRYNTKAAAPNLRKKNHQRIQRTTASIANNGLIASLTLNRRVLKEIHMPKSEYPA
jgi:hypothetical protein